ncbi:hypothetical protein ACFL13_00205 [Patescibacteria group bacterium]
MYIPVIRKINYRKEVFIERSLPKAGEITVEVGSKVEPSQKIGSTKISYEVVRLGEKFKPNNKVNTSRSVEAEVLLGKIKSKKFTTPFKGSLIQDKEGVYFFKSVEQDYWLLPGVWGEVTDVKKNLGVLLKTQTKDINLIASTRGFVSGELIVFPNPTELLEINYLDKYMKSASGKIIYVGHSISEGILKRAKELNVGALLAGSAHREMFSQAYKSGLNLGIVSGFGIMPTPEEVYFALNDVAHRFVFFYGEQGRLSIPIPSEEEFPLSEKEQYFINAKEGVKVQVFTPEYYGHYGIIDSVTESSIFVKLSNNEKAVEVMSPNIFAII